MIQALLRRILPIVLIVASCFWVYQNSLNAPFVWDDEVMVVGNPLIRSFDSFGAVFGSGAFGGKVDSLSFYRPLQIASYSIDYHFWELDPFGYHLSNLILHTVSCLLLFTFVLGLGLAVPWATVAALLFAVHPVGIEAVTYVSGRGDALFLMLSLAGLVVFQQAHRKQSIPLFLVSFLAISAAVFAKENALVVPIIACLYAILLLPRPLPRKTVFFLLGSTSISALYLGFKFFGGLPSATTPLSYISSASLWERILTVPQSLLTYLRLLVYPTDLHMEYHFVTHSITDWTVWLGIPLLYGIYKLTSRCSCKGDACSWQRKKQFCLGVLLLGLLPVNNVWPPLASTVREHWLYLPLVGFTTFVAIQLHQLWEGSKSLVFKALLGLFVIVFVAFLGNTTIDRNEDWTSPVRLYQHDLALEPKSFVLHNNLGVTLYREHKEQEALNAFIQSIQTSPGKRYATPYNNVGVILEDHGQNKDALNYYQQSIAFGNYQLGYVNLGRLLAKMGQLDAAIIVLEKGHEQYPNTPDLELYLSAAYLQKGRKIDARILLEQLLKLTPESNQVQLLYQETLSQ
ncbi:MAG: tetratricopeptide repeat protein [Candidatus Margulisiibacteriota bacterium]